MKDKDMIKKITLGACLLFFGGITNAQIEIHYEGESVVSPSAEVEGDVGGAFAFRGYYIVNTSGDEVSLTWNRLELASQACMSDQVCTDESCYTPFDDGADFASPEPATIPAGDSIYFKVGAASVDDPCCAIHRYYLKTGLGTVQDSIEVKFKIGGTECFLSTEIETKEEISVYPNPAADVFNVTVSNVSDARFQLYNVVGEQVLSTVLTEGTNELNVAALPNGVYFYSVSENGTVLETKKLVVRH